MGLQVHFNEDVAARLVATCVAMLSAAVATGAPDVVYCRAVLECTRANCLGYAGLCWADLEAAIRANLATAGVLDLLQDAGLAMLDA